VQKKKGALNLVNTDHLIEILLITVEIGNRKKRRIKSDKSCPDWKLKYEAVQRNGTLTPSAVPLSCTRIFWRS
jgi:hypothetical protein